MNHIVRSLQEYPGFWALHTLALLTEAVCVFWMLHRSQRDSERRNTWKRSVESNLKDLDRRLHVLEGTSSQGKQVSTARSTVWQPQAEHRERPMRPTGGAGLQEGRVGSPDEVPLSSNQLSSNQLGRQRESQYEGGRPPARPQPVSYYAPVPEADGSFKESQLTREPQYDSLYRLDVAPDGGAASLSLHRNPDGFRAALESPRRYLEPACSYKESTLSGASTPVERAAGFAVLDDARWRVQQKIEVEFQ